MMIWSKVMLSLDVSLRSQGCGFEEKPLRWRDSVISSERDEPPTRRAEKGHTGKLFFSAAIVPLDSVPLKKGAFVSADDRLSGSHQLVDMHKYRPWRKPSVGGKRVSSTDNLPTTSSRKVVDFKCMKIKGFDNLDNLDNLISLVYMAPTRVYALRA